MRLAKSLDRFPRDRECVLMLPYHAVVPEINAPKGGFSYYYIPRPTRARLHATRVRPRKRYRAPVNQQSSNFAVACLDTVFQDMLLSFLFSLLHFLLLAQAARKPKKGKQTTSTVATVGPSLRRITVDATAILPPPPSTTSNVDPLFSDSPTDLFDQTDHTGNIVCQSTPRFSVLHRPDCLLSVEQIHAPTLRGPGMTVPPTSGASSYRFWGQRGHCEIYVTATYVVSVGRTGVPVLWDPSEIEWIQMWIHIRLKVDMILNSCVGEPGASAEELRRVHGGRGGASVLIMDADRLSSRLLMSDRTKPHDPPPPAIQFEILLHDGKDLASLRDQAIALGVLPHPRLD